MVGLSVALLGPMKGVPLAYEASEDGGQGLCACFLCFHSRFHACLLWRGSGRPLREGLVLAWAR